MFSVIVAAGAIAAAAPQSAQAAFDAATKAGEEGRCKEAIAAFDKLAAGPAAQKNKVVAAAISVRRGKCLRRLGRMDEAERAMRAGVAVLEGQREAFGAEARDVYLLLAQMATASLAYDQAIADADRALALSTGDERIVPLQIRSRVTRFDGDGASIRDAQEALKLVQARPNATKAELATSETFAARSLMAAGRLDEARTLMRSALTHNGGLTMRANLADIAVRYDLAQLALLRGDTNGAREYLIYTGAGRISDAPFANAKQIDVPQCGSVPGLTPDSQAVIEFALSDGGVVESAQPIFVNGNREVALAFARAVRGWSWAPEEAAKIPVFYRALTRIELRCTTTGEGSNELQPLTQAVASWLDGRGAGGIDEDGSGAAKLPALRAAAPGNDPAALRANLILGGSRLIGEAERMAAAARAEQLAATLAAPQPVRTYAAVMRVGAPDWSERRTRGLVTGYTALLGRPEVAADTLSAATVRLLLAEARRDDRGRRTADPEGDALVAAVAAEPGLPERHPLRVRALLDQANRAAARGSLDAAQQAFAQTGLTEQQCALIGPKPAMRSSGASSDLYPTELVRAGFEGWTRIEYDIAADGRTVRPRTLIAYPPFLFGDAARKMIERTRYEASYRPSQSVACAGNQSNFVFRMP